MEGMTRSATSATVFTRAAVVATGGEAGRGERSGGPSVSTSSSPSKGRSSNSPEAGPSAFGAVPESAIT